MSAISFQPAIRENVPLLIGLTSGTGGGKTYSALRIAKGIVGPGKRFAGICTENRRMRHYADDFEFDVFDLTAPFTPERFVEAIRAAERAGYAACVIDSATHEWAGPGGVLEMHDDEVSRMAGPNADWRRKEAMNWPAWKVPKERHQGFRDAILAARIPLVLCFRGKTGQKPGVDPQTGKKILVETPFRATTSDDLPYELVCLLVLSQQKPGTVDLSQPNKISKPILPFIRDGEVLDEAFGAKLAAWARGGAQEQARPQRTLRQAVDELRARIQAAATRDALDAVLAEDETGRILKALRERDASAAAAIDDLVRARMAEQAA